MAEDPATRGGKPESDPVGFAAAAPSDDVAGPRFTRVEIAGEPVLLTRTRDSTPVAFGNICPHQNLPLDDGALWGDEVDCPHHHYTYDPHTGRNCFPRRVFPAVKAAEIEGLPTYDVREEGGWVYVGPRHEPSVG